MQQVISREFSIHVGGVQTPEYKEVASREVSVFVGAESDPPFREVVSREVSLVVTTPQVPARVTPLNVSASPMGDVVTLSWAGYNEWAQADVASYDIYMGTRGFTNVAGMTRFATVSAETFSITFSNLPPWEDRFFAVVAVDALGGFDPVVKYASAYIIAAQVISREVSVFIGAEPEPGYREVVSREVSIVVPDATVPAPVTCLDCGLLARDSVNSFSAIDLDWTAYNEVGQKDVAGYHIYLGPFYYTNLAGMAPIITNVPAETKRWTITGLHPYGVYYVAVVAVDVEGQFNPVVRSQSAQASVDRVREVRNLAAACGPDWLTFTWQWPEGADPSENNLLAGYRVYLAGSLVPVELGRFATSHTVTGLLPARGYPVLVATVDNQGHESAGATLLAATLAPNPSAAAIEVTGGLSRLTWERVQPEEIIGEFAVYAAETNFTSVAGMTPVVTTRGHSADFPELTYGQGYHFAVTTRNISGCESWDLPLRVVPFTPTGLQPGAYTDGILSLTVNGPLGASYVLLGSTNLSDWIPLQTNTPAALPFSITLTNVPGMNWFYKVKVE